jgi:hypothetical protein
MELGRRADEELAAARHDLAVAQAQLVAQATRITDLENEVTRLATEVLRLQALVDKLQPKPKMLFGTSAPTGIDELEKAVGARFAVRRSYSSSIPASFAAHDAAKDVGKRASVASVKLQDWSDNGIVAGLAALQRFGLSWPKDHPGFLIVNHEPEDDGKPAVQFLKWQAAAVKAWHEVRPHVPIGGNLMAWTTNPASGRKVDEWVCPDWDFLAWDGYAGPNGTKTISETFGPPLAVNQKYGLRFAIAEYGTQNADLRVKWTEGGAGFTAAANGLFCTYWNSTGTGVGYPWTPDQYPAVKALALEYGGSEL